MPNQSTSVLPETASGRLTAFQSDLGTVASSADHFGPSHPQFPVAAALCAERGHFTAVLLGTACPSCWEAAIRADERFVVAFDLDGWPPAETNLIAPVAVDRAVSGEHVNLTEAERHQVNTRLAATAPRSCTRPAVCCPSCSERVELSARGGEQRVMCGYCGRMFLSGDANAWTGAAR